jgi:sirohydrochlorin ferrochelatase
MRLLFATLMIALATPPVAAQTRTGTLLVAHGADTAWNARVERIARQAETGGPVAVTFLMGSAAGAHPFQQAVRDLVDGGAARIVVVPLLVSSHSGHYEQIRWLAGLTDSLDVDMRHHLAMRGIERPSTSIPLVLTPALDGAGEVARVLADRARHLLAGDDPATRAVFLVGHGPNGPEDHAAWMNGFRTLADTVRALVGFADARAGVVRDDAPPAVRGEAVRGVRDLIALQAAATGADVIVVPIAISHGGFTDRRIRADLDGLPVRYDAEPLLPHPAIVRWIERRVREALTCR